MLLITAVLALLIFSQVHIRTGVLGGMIFSFLSAFLITLVVWQTVQMLLSLPLYLPILVVLGVGTAYTLGHWHGRNWRR